MSALALEEYELLGDARYRSYVSAIDKALKSFEYTSEWADLISALGKLNKVLLSHVKYSIIPRRITISKRLAQCMHPALPSGVHLKALETYDIIFKCIGPARLSQELFIYSAGLFPLLGNAAMNVKPSLLSIYENHFVPLQEKLRPGLNGFLIGVLPGLEEGSDYYDRTDDLLQKVCEEVEHSYFYGCMWKCILSNPTIRLPALAFITNHFNKRLSMEDQLYVIGTDIDTMVQGLCASLQDNSVLVQRCALDLLLLGFPIHNNQLVATDMVQIVTSAITVVLRRDMSLNRRLFSWLMAGEAVGPGDESTGKSSHSKSSEKVDSNSYFKRYSKEYLLKALQFCFDDPQTIMSSVSATASNAELWSYKLLISLLDRPEISFVILDDVLIDIFRSLYLSCNSLDSSSVAQDLNKTDRKFIKTGIKDRGELKKAANLLFGTLEPSYLWEYSAKHFENVCNCALSKNHTNSSALLNFVQKVGSGTPTLTELCTLVDFLLDVVSLETYLEARTEHLPKLLCRIFDAISENCDKLSIPDISITLKLCSKILCKIQPPVINIDLTDVSSDSHKPSNRVDCVFKCSDSYVAVKNVSLNDNECDIPRFTTGSNRVEITSTQSETNQHSESTSHICDKNNVKCSCTSSSVQSTITLCIEKYKILFITFLKMKMLKEAQKSITHYESLVIPKMYYRHRREKSFDNMILKCLKAKCDCGSSEEVQFFSHETTTQVDFMSYEEELLSDHMMLSEAFERLCLLLVELSSFPTFYTNSKSLYDKHLNATRSSVIPEWLKLIISIACFVRSEDIFFSATSTLLDLIALTKSILLNEEINEEASGSPAMSQAESNSPTVVLLALTPTISSLQLSILLEETLMFNFVAAKLWKYVGDERPDFCLRGTELLQQVHSLSPASSVCESVICNSMASGDEMEQIESQKKFCVLWHLTRDLSLKSTPSTMTKGFDRCLFLMLDNLGKETGPQKAISQAWLNHSLQRGDIARFLEPILLILLHPDSARVSIQHVSIHCPKKIPKPDVTDYQYLDDADAKVYAISSISGHVIYHVSDDSPLSSPQASPEKRILALTSFINGNGNKGSTVVTHNSMLQDFDLPSSHERDLKLPISLFINPFGSLSSLASDSHLEYAPFSPPDLSQAKRIENLRKGSFDDDIGDNVSSDSSPEMSVEGVVASVLDDIITQVVCGNEQEKEFTLSVGDNSFSEDYTDFNFSQSYNLKNSQKKFPELNNNVQAQLTVHPLHTYVLLYCQVYDSQKTLYALYSLKAIILTNPRIALCSMSTTNVSNSLSVRGQQLQVLLARHRKSVFGNNFHGELSAEATTVYRSNTFVEVIVSACMYHIRSHYPNLPQVKLTEDEVLGNRNVRLLCMEVLTLIFSELVGIVKDSGKCFASYLNDLLHRCKVQKTLLYCLAASVYDSQRKDTNEDERTITFTETIVEFNERPLKIGKGMKTQTNDFQDTYQVHLLRLMATLIVLEDTVLSQTGSDNEALNALLSKPGDLFSEKKFSHRFNVQVTSSKYQQGVPISSQIMFLSAILTALSQSHHAHLHIHWLSLVTSALPFVGRLLPRLVMTVVNQISLNLESIAGMFSCPNERSSNLESDPNPDLISHMPPDYLITLIEGLTTLCHYCLLECPAPILSPLNQPPLPPVPSQPYAPGTSASQIISNLIHVFSTSSNQKDISAREPGNSLDPIFSARRVLLSNLPRVISGIATVFQIVTEVGKGNQHKEWWIMGTPKIVKQHILSFLSPISLNYGSNFIAAIAVVWHESGKKNILPGRKVVPTWSPEQLLLVELVAAIKVLPLESIIQTVRNVLKQPPPLSQKNKAAVEVNTLQFFLAYIQQTSGSQLIEVWQSLLGLWRDGLQLTSPLVQFNLLAILHEFAQRSPLLEDKKAQKELQDVAHKLIEACSAVACDSLEQTTWLWRNLAVRPGPQSDVDSPYLAISECGEGDHAKQKSTSDDHSTQEITTSTNNAQFSVQALCCLAEFLAAVLDFVYVGEEKEKVVPLLSNMMYYVTPYLKNHSSHNTPSFRACCQLLANVSGYQHTRKAWKKDAFDLLLDSSFFQMSATCIGHWRAIIDHLMTHDKTTFRDFMSRVSVAQSGSLNLFSSKEQEYEQRAHLLKRLAFVIFCSEIDQYQKYMPDIQERLTENLRISHVPVVQAQIFLCFRVLLVRMSPHHVTSLWPVIITEMVQVFTQVEHELCTDTEEFSSHLRRLSTLESSWVVNNSNGLNAHNHPAWLHLYLSVCKLLDMTVALPANVLPQFQMYRWAFIGDSPPLSSETSETKQSSNPDCPEFVPHIMRLAHLLNKKVPCDERLPFTPGQLLLTMPSITSLLHLQPFFNTMSDITQQKEYFKNLNEAEQSLQSFSKSRSAPELQSVLSMSHKNLSKNTADQIEGVLENDFLEPCSL